MSWAERAYRLTLRALPRDVRDRDGDAMADTFRRVVHTARQRGRAATVVRVAAELADVAATGLALRGERLVAALPGLGPAIRRLVRRPVYALAVVGTLALGVGASTSMVSVAGTVVLNALPFPEADRLVHLWSHRLEEENTIPSTVPSSFLAWRELDDLFTVVEGFHRDTRVLTGDGDPEQLRVAVVTPGLLDLLGVRPVLGRAFVDPEGRPGDDAWVLLGAELWARRYGSDPDLVGRRVTLDGRGLTVLGILPRDFGFPSPDTEAWLPVAPVPSALTPAQGPPAVPALDVLARLRPGLDREAANEALVARAAELEAAGALPGEVPDAQTLDFFITPQRTRDTLVLLTGAVLLVLLIAAANVLSLGLSQAVDRGRELAVRHALGAGQLRLLGELLAENLAMAVAGSALGLGVAHLVLTGLAPRLPEQLAINTWGQPLSIWPHGVPFALAAALLTAPAVTLLTRSRLRGDGSAHLGSRRDTDTGDSLRLQQALMVAQTGLAVVLLSGTALMAGSVLRLQRVDTGFDLDRLLAVSLRIPTELMMEGGGAGASPADRATLMDGRFVEMEAALRRVPGVVGVGTTTSPLPLTRARFRPRIERSDGRLLTMGRDRGATPGRGDVEAFGPADAGAMFLPMSEVQPGFFEAAGVAVVEGRGFQASDDPATSVVVNETLARRLWPDAPAVGRSFRIGPDDPWLTVVGVVEPTVQMTLRDQWGDGLEIYTLLDRARFGVYRTFLLRTSTGDPAALTNAVRRAVWGVDPTQPIERLLPMAEAYGDTIQRERFFLVFLGVFAGLAAALAAAGIYALLSRSLARRTRELGIRMALGARPGQILARLTRTGLGPTLLGTAVGLAAAWPLSRLLDDLLFGVEPGDPGSLAATAALLLVIAALACVGPARRALHSDVVASLRGD